MHERVEIWCAACHLHSLFFLSLPRITHFVNISTYQAWLLEAQTAGEPSPLDSSMGDDLLVAW